MKAILKFVLFILLASPLSGLGQQKDTLVNKLDSLSKMTDSAGGQINNINPAAYNERTKLSATTYFTLLGNDLKQAFTKPFHMKNKDWGRLGKFVLITGALTFSDEPIQKLVFKTTNNNGGIKKISSVITTFGGLTELYTLSAFGAYGVIFKKPKMVTTTLLATQAYITGGAVESVSKFLTHRTRPSFYSNGVVAEPKFLGPFSNTKKDANGKKINTSFPSGHTTVIFAAATVFAKEYRDNPVIPIIAYSMATLVGISRVVENVHWTTDVVVGAALGYLSGRLVVNNYHRYAKIKAPNQNKNTVSFNVGYNHGVICPGLIYKFH
jgi:membrane-associated phospholipid phosphatase